MENKVGLLFTPFKDDIEVLLADFFLACFIVQFCVLTKNKLKFYFQLVFCQ